MSWSRDFFLAKNIESQLCQDLLSLHELLLLSVLVVLTVLPQLSRLLLSNFFSIDLLLVVNILQNKLFLYLIFGSTLISSVFWWFLRSIQIILNFEIKALTLVHILLELLVDVSDVYLLLILLCAFWFWSWSFGTMSILLLEFTEIDVVMSILLSILFLLHIFLVVLRIIIITRLIVLIILIIVDFLTILHLQVLVIFRFKHLILVILLLRLFFHS